MKKLFFALLCLCSSLSMFALTEETSVGKYKMSAFNDQEYDVWVERLSSAGKCNYKIDMQIGSNYIGDRIYMMVMNNKIDGFKKAMMAYKDQFLAWKTEAEANNVKDTNKPFSAKFPLIYFTIVDKAGKSYTRTGIRGLVPYFVVDKDGVCQFVLTADTVYDRQEGNYSYSLRRDFYFILQSGEDFDALLDLLDKNR